MANQHIKGRVVLFTYLLVISSNLTAQEFDFKREVAPFAVQDESGVDLQFPFLGGLNAPRPQFVDIDGDGDVDLFVQEENSTSDRPGTLMFFENIGSPTDFKFAWRTDTYQDLDVGNWYKFVDVDQDGDFDLFAETPFALIRYWRNDGSAANANFVLLEDSLRAMDGEAINFDIGSLPELADIDCDGDFDLLVGRAAAGTITLFESRGLDASGIPIFEEIPGNFQNISIIGESSPAADAASANKFSRHGSNSLTVADVDNDQDPDIFWGDLFEPSVVFLENRGTCQDPSIDIATRRFPVSQPVLSSGFNAPRLADIDADGDIDLFVAVLGGAFSPVENLAENFFFYRNVGSPEQPIFDQATRRLLPNLDVGANSIPALADLEGDGDLDLIIGNEAAVDNQNTARLHYYLNTGTSEAPSFQLQDANFLGLEIGFNYAPAFVDIDADGDLDLYIGEWNGRLNYIENVGGPGGFVAGQAEEVSARDNGEIKAIDIGNNNAPAFADIDGDGDYDLFVGEFIGNINFFENTGDASAPAFELRETNYLDIDVGLYSAPHFTDIDRDGDLDLLVGSEGTGIHFYRNRGTSTSANFSADAAFDLRVIGRSAPIVADIDSDSDADFLSGTAKGGLFFYRNQSVTTHVADPSSLPDEFVLHQNYPNPFNAATTILYDLPVAGHVELTVYNVLGKPVRTLVDARQPAATYRVIWDGKTAAGAQASSGIYFYQLRARNFTATRQLVFLR